MSRNGISFLKPGDLVHKMTKFEKDRKKTIQKNKITFDALGIKSLKNSMFGSIEKDNSESCRVEKRKVGETDNDEDYQPLDDDEGLSSSSDNGESFDSQVIEVINVCLKSNFSIFFTCYITCGMFSYFKFIFY